MSNEWIETSTGYTRLRQDGILEVRSKDGAIETLEMAKEHVQLGRELIGDDGPRPMLLVFGGMSNLTSAARDYYAKGAKPKRNTDKLAMVIDSHVSRVLGNIFLGLNRPSIPIKLFTNEDEAVDWLKSGLK